MLLFRKTTNILLYIKIMIFKIKSDQVKEAVTLVKQHTIQETHFTLKCHDERNMLS